MFQKLTRYTFALITLVLYCPEATADEALMDGIRPFICEGEAIVFQETNNGWVIATDPTAEVKPIKSGWRYIDTLSDDVRYLKKESRNSWVIEGLSEDGHFKLDCIDFADSVSQVVTIIKPRLDAAIISTQNNLLEAKEALASSEKENVQLIQALEEQRRAAKNALTLLAALEDQLAADLTSRTVMQTALDTVTDERAALVSELAAAQADNDFKKSLLESLNVSDANRVNVAIALELELHRTEFFERLRDVFGSPEGVRIEGDRFVFSSEVLFPPGRAALSPEGRGEVAKVASILLAVADDIPDGIDWIIRVDGHTDNVPLSGLGEFADNWELSQARALSLVRYMVNFLGIQPTRLAANGFGQFQPVNLEDSDEARAQNRRIELIFTEK